MESTVTTATAKGPRPYQEDRFVALTREERSLLAVLDGHGGAGVAEYCARYLNTILPETVHDIQDIVHMLAMETDSYEDGSTLSLVSVTPKAAIVAVLGDSPVVVVDCEGRIHIGPEHNVRTNLVERAAAVARGGYYSNGYICVDDDGLQMSRALGDAALRYILSREPAIDTIANPRWVLVASDGVVDPSHADANALDELITFIDSDTDAAGVIEWAKKRGLQDNATAVLWRLA